MALDINIEDVCMVSMLCDKTETRETARQTSQVTCSDTTIEYEPTNRPGRVR